MKKILLLTLFSLVVFAETSPLLVELDIYSNRSFLKQSYELGRYSQIDIDVPQNISIESIRYVLPKGCLVKNKILKNPNQDKLSRKKVELQYKILALKEKSKLLKTLSLQREQDTDKIENISKFLVDSLTKNLLIINSMESELDKIKKSISLGTKELKTTFECNDYNKKVEIIYPLNVMKYTPFYNINANIPNKSVIIEKKATLFVDAPKDYEDINIIIHSYKFNQNIAPRKFYPEYLGGNKNKLYAKRAVMLAATPANVEFKETLTKSLYKIKNASIKKGEKNTLNIDKLILNASFKSVIDSYGTNRAYLEATIKSNKNLSGAMANFFLNQNPISSRHIGTIKKGVQTKLYFGEDEHIQVKKELVKTLDEKTFFGDKKISTQNWKYTISNKKPFSTDIEFIARVPVSKNADIVVKTLAIPKYNYQNAKGRTVWNFKLNPNENKDIIFGYEISNIK